ncbi:replicative DNA helicase [Peribacillus cavernae]|uniref:Replicative DNA helicase n=1 Tax=Peribacillus cavernae TaxID=1674310 RepID=A0A3S0VW83_9BACI|nr:replicative DNA helicase [Peribacillus cavernae]MDQ0221347.1 replicative DNA helicase [Peribacillus cavernae]RUQ27478.1 replicative DNA helicase [Peribacillus cavernae]
MEAAVLFNQEAEEAVIGSLFLEEDLIKDCTLIPEHFYLARLKRILWAMKRLDEQGKPIDVISVVEQIGTQNLEKIGGISYLTDLAGSVPSTANFNFYQDTVLEYSQKRKAIEIAGRMIEEAKTEEIGSTIHKGIQQLMAIEQNGMDGDSGSILPCLTDIYYDCEMEIGDITGIPSGFNKLDQLTGGFQESDFIVIGARPSVGKTAFALHIAVHAAEEHISLIFSLEMAKKQLLKRAASSLGHISTQNLRNPRKYFDDLHWAKLADAMGKLSLATLHIYDRAAIDISYIWSQVRKMRKTYGEGKKILVVIDYLQLIVGDPKHNQNRQAEISAISRDIKHMARELNVTVIALSQLSRGVESRQNKRPMLSDLRESGQIEQDADLIAFLYRDDYYDRDSEEKNIIEVILAKQRNGPIGTVDLHFHKEFGVFEDVEKGDKVGIEK